jgi:hypothetical protein
MGAITVEEFRVEQEKLLIDRSKLNETLSALNIRREQTISQLAMCAGALQTIEAFIQRLDPEVDLEAEIDMATSDPNDV